MKRESRHARARWAFFVCVVIGGLLFIRVGEARAQCVAQPSGFFACLEAVDAYPLGARVPLILVHGWNQNGQPALPQGSTWDVLVRAFSARPALLANFKPYLFKYWSNDVEVRSLGAYLRDALDLASAADLENFGQKSIVIVSHSMGGLVSREYMRQSTGVGKFAGAPGAQRVLRLITLATPHHGSPMANGPAMAAKVASDAPLLAATLPAFDAAFYLTGAPSWAQVNRSDLRWDNYSLDPARQLNYGLFPEEINTYLVELNSDPSNDFKVVPYAGYISPSGLLDKYSTGAAVIAAAFGETSDGIVPLGSARFSNAAEVSRGQLSREDFSGYDHTQMAAGDGTARLFQFLEVDLLAVLSEQSPGTGLMTTVAGGGPGGVPALATEAALDPDDVALDAGGNLFIAERYADRVYRVDKVSGVMSVLAGGGSVLGDNGPAIDAALSHPVGVAVDQEGNVLIADSGHHRVRKVWAATGFITTLAGTGVADFYGDGGPAGSAALRSPNDVAVDDAGNVFICDRGNNRVRRIDAATGIISTCAGVGTQGFSGDGGPAVSAEFDLLSSVALDRSHNLYITDQGNHRVRKVAASSGVVTTVAGSGALGYSGDGGAASDAGVPYPYGVVVDRRGNLYVSTRIDGRVRMVSAATGVITTVAGAGGSGNFPGDGGAATAADLVEARGLALDSSGNLYIAHYFGHRVRMVPLGPAATAPAWIPGDFTGDLTSDLLWRHAANGDMWLWSMEGGAKAGDDYVGLVADPNWEIRGQGDLNGDGMADLLWRHKTDGTVYYWEMNGHVPVHELYVSTVDTAYDIVGTGDFDGNGKADILWRNPAVGDLWLWRMNGAEVLGQSYVDTVDLGYGIQGLGDVNGDLRTDIVWQGAAGDIWAWLMTGAVRDAQTYVGTVADATYQIEQVADFDADLKADLLWRNSVQGDLWIWLMDGAAKVSEHYVGIVADMNYRIQAAGDYNGDGKADLLWRNLVAGDLWVWLMNGPVKQSEHYVGMVADQEYQIVR